MIRFQTSAEVKDDRRVVLELPPETPVGKADLTVTVSPQCDGNVGSGRLRQHFGTVRSGDTGSSDNDPIDADLARAYEDSHDEAT
ncbi:MAG: hypothetical protein O3C40_03495 [Planctomycetota bacterium]|nr:hypothetical protein [Planctomycetota bacterium]